MEGLDIKGVGRRIRTERDARQLSVDAIAKEAAVPATVIEQLERGELTEASLDVLGALAHALDVPLVQLLTDATMTLTKEELAEAREREAAAFFTRLPLSLQTFVEEERAASRTIAEDALKFLAGIEFACPPATPDEWRRLMSAMMQGLYPA